MTNNQGGPVFNNTSSMTIGSRGKQTSPHRWEFLFCFILFFCLEHSFKSDDAHRAQTLGGVQSWLWKVKRNVRWVIELVAWTASSRQVGGNSGWWFPWFDIGRPRSVGGLSLGGEDRKLPQRADSRAHCARSWSRCQGLLRSHPWHHSPHLCRLPQRRRSPGAFQRLILGMDNIRRYVTPSSLSLTNWFAIHRTC